MIAARQRTTRIEEPPVLFRLPNLRKSSADLDISQSNLSPSSTPEFAYRVDAPEASYPRPHQEPISPQLATASVANAAIATPAIASSYADVAPAAKSWMERVGSRLILLVTLIVIVSAAWVTGRRMPASKPGGESAQSLTQVESASDKREPEVSLAVPTSTPEDAVATVTEPLSKDSVSDFSESESTSPLTEIDVDAPASMPASQIASLKPQVPDSVQSYVSGAVTEPRTSVFSTASSPMPPVPSDNASPVPADNASVATDANVGSTIPASTPAQLGDSALAQSPSVKTKTPNELTLDPAVLVPWVLEKNKSQQPVLSATPNPVIDWGQYLPSSNTPAASSVRAVSATEPTGMMQPAQQASYPNTATANPYNR